ncbi:hypothetical protein [Mesorhizobium montanum]|uniref:hypothetical protein n=1 Tax=Mesorhizobium montanum TaxID=3072323 RepID=UPI003D3222A2
MPVPDDFMLVDRPVPVPQHGELLVRTLWLSVDPYMRARLSPAKNYAAGLKVGDSMQGEVSARSLRRNRRSLRSVTSSQQTISVGSRSRLLQPKPRCF